MAQLPDAVLLSIYTENWLAALAALSLKGAIILIVAGAFAVALRRAAAATRHLVWSLALTSLLVLPVLSMVLPAWNMPALPGILFAVQSNGGNVASGYTPSVMSETVGPRHVEQPAITPETAETESQTTPQTAAEISTSLEEGAAGPSDAPLGWQTLALLVWLAGMVAAGMRLLVGTANVWRITRRAKVVTDDCWATMAAHLAEQMELGQKVRLLENARVTMPITCGLLKPAVLLPPDTAAWPEELRQVVLSHELAHIKRKDCLTQMLARIVCALYWFNPMVWLAARRLRVERERACDDQVLSTGTRASDYAGYLLDLARSIRSPRYSSLMAVAIARRSQLEGRLLAILDPELKRRSLNRPASIVAVLVVACVVLPLAAIRPFAHAASLNVTAAQVEGSTQQQSNTIEIRERARTVSAEAAGAIQTSGSEPVQTGEIESRHPQAEQNEQKSQSEQEPQKEGQKSTTAEELLMQSEKDGVAGAFNEILNENVRQQVMQSLGQAGGREAVETLIQSLDSGDWQVRKRAAWALGLRGDSQAVEPLIQGLGDQHWEVREQAAWALGLKGDKRAIEPLTRTLKDSNPNVREQAAWALGLRGNLSSVDALIAALNDASPNVREQAAWALGLRGDSRAVEVLMALLQSDPNDNVREQAAWALGMRADHRAIDVLKAALKDKDNNVRKQAAWALGMVLVRGGHRMSGGSEDSGSGMEVKADRHRDWVIKPHPVERVNPKP